MKTIMMLFALIFSIAAFGQSSNYEIVPVQAGTVNLINANATINLDSGISADLSGNKEISYFVQLTPIGNCGVLKLGEKGNNSFTVTKAGLGSDNGSFDYIVFVKYPRMQLQQNIQPLKVNSAPGK